VQDLKMTDKVLALDFRPSFLESQYSLYVSRQLPAIFLAVMSAAFQLGVEVTLADNYGRLTGGP